VGEILARMCHLSFSYVFSLIIGSDDVLDHVYVVPRLSCELRSFEGGFWYFFSCLTYKEN